MFKRYSKGDSSSSAPKLEDVPIPSPSLEKAPRERKRAPVVSKAQNEAIAKEQKRREKMLDIRMDLHKQLLETLNLSVIDKASEGDLRREIAAITNEGLRERSALTRWCRPVPWTARWSQSGSSKKINCRSMR